MCHLKLFLSTAGSLNSNLLFDQNRLKAMLDRDIALTEEKKSFSSFQAVTLPPIIQKNLDESQPSLLCTT